MARVATRADLAAMRVLGMARRAVAPEVGFDAGRVAARALEIGVRADECKAADAAVIELRLIPSGGVVATPAICAEGAAVRIVVAMAAFASRRQGRGEVLHVARLARQALVTAAQWEARDPGVIEARDAPSDGAVAAPALRAVAAGMGVVAAMA